MGGSLLGQAQGSVSRARVWEIGAGGLLAGLAGSLLAGALPLPDPLTSGPAGIARALLWLGGAGGLVGACIGGLVGAAHAGRIPVVAARGLIAAAWGLWVGALGAIAITLAAHRLWSALDLSGPVASLPPGPLAMGPVAWVAAIALWAGLLGLLLPFAPGRPGGRPAVAGACGGAAGIVGGAVAAFTGLVAPAALLVGAAIALAGAREQE
ncbi:MAG: hypothetical protein FJZ01_02480 [Candidatus Sericytochromatia bacterium]|nr:hypothetical protein [Candidatus Tanganyikabacteria bacterium]